MKENYENCLARILQHEGGYVNDPDDPGGETNWGIPKRSYPKLDIKNLTRTQAAAIYKKDYYDKVRGGELPAGLDMVVFDAAINSGPSQSIKWLQKGLNRSDVTVDGKLGPITMKAVQDADTAEVIEAACDARLAFLRGLSTWWKFGKGWTSRVREVKTSSLAMVQKKPVMCEVAPVDTLVAVG